MAARSMILEMLKTPQQVRQEQQQRLQEQALGQAQLMQPRTSGTTALPGLLSQFAASQMARQGPALAQTGRRAASAAGQIAGGLGASPETVQQIARLGVPQEEQQAGRIQQVLRNANMSNLPGLKQTLQRLQQAGAPANVIMALSDRIRELESQPVEAPETRTLKIGDELVTQQFNPQTGQFEEIARAPRYKTNTQVNVNTGGEDAFTEAVGERLGAAYTDSMKSVSQAEVSLQNLAIMENILDQDIITGPFAESRTAVEKILAQAGIVDGQRVANTEAFLASAAQQTLSLLGTGAVGTGTAISDKDREFLEKAAGANISLTEESIRRIININKYVAQGVFNAHNQLVDRTRQVFPESKDMTQERYYPGQKIQLPDGTIQIFDPVQGWIDE